MSGRISCLPDYMPVGFSSLDLMHAICPRENKVPIPVYIIGFLHPIIHLGFGVEFQQPAIVAEALAQAAIHSAWQDEFFFAVDEEVKRNRYSPAHLVDILDNIRADKKLSGAVLWEDDNKIRDGILVRAKDEMVKYASQWRVEPDRLEEAVAEMTNAAGESRYRYA